MHTDMLPDFLHLYHAFPTGGTQLISLLEHFGNDPSRICSCSPSQLRALGVNARNVARIGSRISPRVKRDLDWQCHDNNHLVCYDDAAYPPLLLQIADFPPLLYASGRLGLLRDPQIAIVGSRLCTPGGEQTAFEFASLISTAGLSITSGLALGIDAAAHRGALESGGNTIAVIGTGIDRDYPLRNRRLAQAIRQYGLVVSEFPLGSSARGPHFPQRNRIISGLSVATLVVEATARSGSLITARLAAEQGREVFAVPGSIHNPQTRGCHALIRDGATLIEEPGDITRELTSLIGYAVETRETVSTDEPNGMDAAHQQLLECIGFDPVDCDLLVQRSGLTIEQLSSMLLLLELNDLIQSAPGGCYVRI